MFTKNIKTIVIVAVALVVAILVSCLVAVNNDKKVADQVASDTKTQIETLNKTIASLNATIEALENGLADAEDLIAAQQAVIDALGEAGIKLDNWNAATEVFVEKAEALSEIIDTFFVYSGELTDEVRYTTYQVYGDIDEDVYDVYEQAIYDLIRATSVEEMETIIADVEAYLAAIPTLKEKLYAAIEAVEADDITFEDYETIVEMNKLHAKVVDYDLDVENEVDEKADVDTKVAEINLAFRPTAVEVFVTLANDLPATKLFDVDTHEAVAEVVEAGEFAYTLYTDDEWVALAADDEDFADALEITSEALDRVAEIEAIVANAKLFNAYIDTYAETTIGPNLATLEWVKTLEGYVTAWGEYLADNDVETDAESEDYVPGINALVKVDAVEAYRASYDTAVAKLVASFQTFVDAVDSIETITPDSREVLDVAKDAYKTCIKEVGPNPDIFDDLVEAEDGKGINDYYVLYLDLETKYAAMNAHIEATNAKLDTLNSWTPVLDDNGESTGEYTRGDVRTNITSADIAEVEALMYDLYVVYGLDLSVLNADSVAAYTEGRLVPHKNAAYAAIDAAYEAYVGAYADLAAELKAARDLAKEHVEDVDHAGYTYTVTFVPAEEEGVDGTWVVSEDAAVALVDSYGAADWVDAQFKAVVEK